VTGREKGGQGEREGEREGEKRERSQGLGHCPPLLPPPPHTHSLVRGSGAGEGVARLEGTCADKVQVRQCKVGRSDVEMVMVRYSWRQHCSRH
jgi:hypothetical protein